MSEFKGTPGPWQKTSIPFEMSGIDSAASIYGPYLNGGSPFITDHISLSPGREQAEANANLIAAAPELLEALGDMIFFIERSGIEIPDDVSTDPIDRAKAAIAKALKQP